MIALVLEGTRRAEIDVAFASSPARLTEELALVRPTWFGTVPRVLDVDTANRSVSRAESIRKFVLLPHDFTLERNELTPSLPSLKVRRHIVSHTSAHLIDPLHAHDGAD